MNNLILIPARGGSTRVKNKNIKLLGSIPLICHSIATSLEVSNSRVIVSSDDDEIISVSRKFGAETPFKRPDRLSKNDSPSIDVILHTLEWLK